MQVGSWARVVGLVSRSDLNGSTAQIGQWHEDKGRWELRCASGTVLVKPANLQVLGNAPTEIVSKTLLQTDTLDACLAHLTLGDMAMCSSVCYPPAHSRGKHWTLALSRT